MLAGASVQLVHRHLHQVEPSLAQQEAEIKGAGGRPDRRVVVQQIQAAGLEPGLAGAREIGLGDFDVAVGDDPFRVVSP